VRIRIDTVKELHELPVWAVVYDHGNKTWQKFHGQRWATPGVAGVFPIDDIELPAYLLDDGL
jgi:hypothetical protein